MKKYEDTAFKLSQRSRHKIKMKLKDYVSYIKLQHDEDPLYIFDEKVPLHSCYSLCAVSPVTNCSNLNFVLSVWGNCTRIVEGLQCSKYIQRRLL